MMTPRDVVDAQSFANFAHERLGVPYPSGASIAILKKKSKQFLELNPRADWQTFVRVVDWARAKKRRPAHVWWLVDAANYAFADGYLPELDPNGEVVEDEVTALLMAAAKEESNHKWQDRLLSVRGERRMHVYEEWLEYRRVLAAAS